MKTGNDKTKHAVRVLTSLLLLIVITAASPDSAMTQSDPEHGYLSMEDPAVRNVMRIQDRYTPTLMALENVNGTGTGLSENGELAIIVFCIDDRNMDLLPLDLEGVPVIVRVIGEVTPAVDMGENTLLKGASTFTVSSTSTRYSRPAPIGSSTGNWTECGAGTIGVRVRRGNEVFVLSCNHVFARLNYAALNEQITQPGRGDVGCGLYPADTIGRLASFEVLKYGSGNYNTMDAALVRTNPFLISASTPSGGYGTPSTVTLSPALNMSVKKYGKRTGLTTGMVAAVNVTVSVNYAAGTAYFSGQVVISGSGFVDGGDSGSLVVTNNSSANPVGLVFAKSGSSYAFASPINPILIRFDVQIDNGSVSPLPVELSAFSGYMKNSDVHLKWRTETELQNYGFMVQRSADKKSWSDMQFVPGAGESFSPRDYAHVDVDVARQFSGMTVFYRLIQIDRDGTETPSSVLEITQRPVAATLTVYPHPVRTEATLQMSLTESAAGTLSLYDASGREVGTGPQRLELDKGSHVFPISASSLSPGTYFIEFSTASGVIRKPILITR